METKAKNKVLYYPNIEFQDEDYSWLIRASLFWDEVYRIVPENYTPQDNKNIKLLSESGDIGKHLIVRAYECDIETGWDIEKIKKQASKEFFEDYGHIVENFLEANPDWQNNVTRFFCAKSDYNFLFELDKKGLIIKSKKADLDSQEWVNLPKVLGDAYMSYLTRIIADKKGMAVATPKHSPWLAASRISPSFTEQNCVDYDGTFLNFPISIYDVIPEDYCDKKPNEILDFRERRKDERRELMRAYESFCGKLCKVENYEEFKDVWNTEVSKIQVAINQYKKAADILKVSKWCGRISIMGRIALNVMNVTNFRADLQPFVEFGVESLEIGRTFLTNNNYIYESPYNYFCQVNCFIRNNHLGDLHTNFID